ncbi:hypothetical protein SLEP1_g49738 [Rubroshorea leprosula]|uniref:Gnk2-homologous domain-containing protein n=1 Tax=Rubroshorea leprosula TaxID=152421 RepID=A0AAV5M126_9ROSI|nr:hypothetical protein SLEP1_g49738 [Rubroshorea leprosula]
MLLQNICLADNNVSTAGCKDPNSGFYKTTAGEKSEKIYGLVQCRGDVSAANCANCTNKSVAVALQDCLKSKTVKVWFTWCYLRDSDQPFFSVWDKSTYKVPTHDDPSVGSQGFNFLNGLAAATLMLQARVLNVGQSGKGYGMVQCTRDISRANCSKCFDAQLMTFRTIVGNSRGWEIYGYSCSMWYHDNQFYFSTMTISSISVP